MKGKHFLTCVGKTNDFKEQIRQGYRQSRSPEQQVSTKKWKLKLWWCTASSLALTSESSKSAWPFPSIQNNMETSEHSHRNQSVQDGGWGWWPRAHQQSCQFRPMWCS